MSHDTIADGNCAGPEGPDIRYQARGLTPASDVNDRTKVKANAGTTVAAGVVSGARSWSTGCVNRRSVTALRSLHGERGRREIPTGEKCRSGGVWPK